MYSHSVVHKKNFFVFGYECPDEAKYVILGMLLAIWIAGFVLFLTCVCCGCNLYGRYDKENGLTAFREKREKAKKAKEDEEAAPMMGSGMEWISFIRIKRTYLSLFTNK